MPVPRDTKAYIHKDVLREIDGRAGKLRRYKADLFRLLTLIPLETLKTLADKYLDSKKRPDAKVK